MQKSLNLFGIGMQGKSPKATAQKRVNCYYEITPDGDRNKVIIHGTPGLELWVNNPPNLWRGGIEYQKNAKFYAVQGSTFYEISSSGVLTSRGTLNTTLGHVYMAHNGTEIFITDGTDGWIYTVGTTTFSQIVDADFPANPKYALFHNGRFLTIDNGTGRFYGSDLYAGANWTGTNFATAEYSPDNLVRIGTMQGVVCLFGNETSEFWSDTGSIGFPYARIGQGLDFGLAASESLAMLGNSFIFMAHNRMGKISVAKLEGFNAAIVSPPELNHILNTYSTISDATAYSYMLSGHPMYQITFPTENKSWLYDGITDLWSETSSKDTGGRHRGDWAANYGNDVIVADYVLGRLHKLKPTVYTDAGDDITMELIGKHIFSNDKNIRIPSLEIVFESGLGNVTDPGSDPQVAVAFSFDGGHSFGTERWASLGKIGEYTKRAIWRRNGHGRDIVVRLRISDPIRRTIVGANWRN